MSARSLLVATALLAGGCVAAPATRVAPPAEEPAAAPSASAAPSEPAAESERPYEVAASLTTFFLPGEDDIISPVVQVDADAIHFEVRYAYEDRDSGSMFAGANWGMGSEEEGPRVDATIMAGAVGGKAQGVIPAYRLSLSWSFLAASTEGEYVFGVGDDTSDFFYSWSEALVAPVDWLYAGVAAQRLKPVDSDKTLDVGPLLGVAFDAFYVTVYAMNPGGDDDYAVLSVGVTF